MLLGIGFVAIGLYSLFGGGEELAAATRDRAFWFGITAILIGVVAAVVSLLVKNLENIWCRPPRRW